MKEIRMEEFLKLKPEEIQLVDVREPIEFNYYHIEWSKLIPKGELVERQNELNKEEPLYLICRSWNRSMFMTIVMTNFGFDAINVQWWIQEYVRLKR